MIILIKFKTWLSSQIHQSSAWRKRWRGQWPQRWECPCTMYMNGIDIFFAMCNIWLVAWDRRQRLQQRRRWSCRGTRLWCSATGWTCRWWKLWWGGNMMFFISPYICPSIHLSIQSTSWTWCSCSEDGRSPLPRSLWRISAVDWTPGWWLHPTNCTKILNTMNPKTHKNSIVPGYSPWSERRLET